MKKSLSRSIKIIAIFCYSHCFSKRAPSPFTFTTLEDRFLNAPTIQLRVSREGPVREKFISAIPAVVDSRSLFLGGGSDRRIRSRLWHYPTRWPKGCSPDGQRIVSDNGHLQILCNTL